MKSAELDSDYFRLIMDNVPLKIIVTDTEGIIRYANPGTTRLTGYSIDEILGKTPKLWGGQMDKSFYENLWNTIKKDKKTFSAEIINKRKNGEKYVARITIKPITDKNGKLAGFLDIEEDITDFKRLSDRLHARTRELEMLYDPSTGPASKIKELKGLIGMLESQLSGQWV